MWRSLAPRPSEGGDDSPLHQLNSRSRRPSSAEQVRVLDQVIGNAVDDSGVNLCWHAWQEEARHVFLIDHDGADLDTIANLGSQVRTEVKQLSVPCADLVMSRSEQAPVRLHDLRVQGITGDKLLKVAMVVRGNLSIDYLAWNAHQSLLFAQFCRSVTLTGAGLHRPIGFRRPPRSSARGHHERPVLAPGETPWSPRMRAPRAGRGRIVDRKSPRLNSSH